MLCLRLHVWRGVLHASLRRRDEESGILDSSTQGSEVNLATSMNEVVLSNGPTIPCALGGVIPTVKIKR
jgi:hypothetical protein